MNRLTRREILLYASILLGVASLVFIIYNLNRDTSSLSAEKYGGNQYCYPPFLTPGTTFKLTVYPEPFSEILHYKSYPIEINGIDTNWIDSISWFQGKDPKSKITGVYYPANPLTGGRIGPNRVSTDYTPGIPPYFRIVLSNNNELVNKTLKLDIMTADGIGPAGYHYKLFRNFSLKVLSPDSVSIATAKINISRSYEDKFDYVAYFCVFYIISLIIYLKF